MATIEQPAHNAHTPGNKNMTGASQSQSTGAESSGSAGTATGQAPPSSTLSDRAVAWARDARGLSSVTLLQLNVFAGTEFFPKLDRKSEGLFFRYGDGWKARSFPEKAFISKKGTKPGFWNLNAVLAGSSETVFITEGELDACSLVEAGISADAVLSVPTGGRDRGNEESGLSYVGEALDAGLNRVRKFVLCVDADAKGIGLRESLAVILGKVRVWFVDWPEGLKDANDMLISDGPEALLDLITNGALEWPVRAFIGYRSFQRSPQSKRGTQGSLSGMAG